ncbi:MAG: hypothetical protein UW03_C0034G0017 [Candidatus Peregrinibacteria bacterium GW2011_GWA2_43_8]|nr:MAG: hypothetical protein UW03_C0034G0017 [Candidatus Peregrinibacteria bacterium GW2011_GWA2_43_8]
MCSVDLGLTDAGLEGLGFAHFLNFDGERGVGLKSMFCDVLAVLESCYYYYYFIYITIKILY